jgi:nucleotide-binding universal stress UspA family protein
VKILLAADGSGYTKKAARHLVEHAGWFKKVPEILVLHVRAPLPYPGAAAYVGKKAIEKYERDEAKAALKVAEKVLAKAGIPYQSAWRIGDVAAEIAAYAKKKEVDLIAMGSHGHGALAGLALGSVTTKVIATTSVPVLVVR